ncbi:hypothetical protein NQZ68_000864 [Dissostichus eleginoides]|nr:hypothetical protein NQZ68_000864 [Dissostichus eleginoides]
MQGEGPQRALTSLRSCIPGGPALFIHSVAFGRCFKKSPKVSGGIASQAPLGGAIVRARKPPQPAGIE